MYIYIYIEYNRLRVVAGNLRKKKTREYQITKVKKVEEHTNNKNIQAYFKGILEAKTGYQQWRNANILKMTITNL